jgi:uncharacterized protein Yka (UPF0111/DUF47 family)
MMDYARRRETTSEIDDRVCEAQERITHAGDEVLETVEDVEKAEEALDVMDATAQDVYDAAREKIRDATDTAGENYRQADGTLETSQDEGKDRQDRLNDGAEFDKENAERVGGKAEGLHAGETAEKLHRVVEMLDKSAESLSDKAREVERILKESEREQREYETRVSKARG